MRRVGLMGFVGKSGGSHYEHTLLKMASPVIIRVIAEGLGRRPRPEA